MKMFKKLMAVVLTGALAVSMLTGCSLVDNMKKANALSALGDYATAKLDKDDDVTKIKFEEKSSLNSLLAKQLKDADKKDLTAEAVEELAGVQTIDGTKYVISVVGIKNNTSSVSNFKDYADDMYTGLFDVTVDGSIDVYGPKYEVKSKTATVKVGIKVQSFKDAAKKSQTYVIVMAEAEKETIA